MLESLLEGIPGVLDPIPGTMLVHCAEVVVAWYQGKYPKNEALRRWCCGPQNDVGIIF